jgi:hypothetical protein
MFKWRKSKKEKPFSIPFWKRVFICFGKPLYVYHNLVTGRIDCEFTTPAQTHYRIPLAEVQGSFSFPPSPLKFFYYEIEDSQKNLLVARDIVQNYVQTLKRKVEI